MDCISLYTTHQIIEAGLRKEHLQIGHLEACIPNKKNRPFAYSALRKIKYPQQFFEGVSKVLNQSPTTK